MQPQCPIGGLIEFGGLGGVIIHLTADHCFRNVWLTKELN